MIRLKKVFAFIFLSVVAACATVERTEQKPGSFAWFELVTASPENAANFYSQVFGWRFSDPADQVRSISHNRGFIGNLVASTDSENATAQWLPVLSVSDTQTEVGRVQKLGGQLLERSEDFALIRDAAGAEVVLYDGPGGAPLGGAAATGDWIWADLFTSRTSAARQFYGSLLGFETRTVSDETGRKFEVFSQAGEDRGGLIFVKSSQIEPNWMPYILVGDIDNTLKDAVAAGARILERDGNVAILIDPVGAAIGIAERSGEE